MRAKATQTIRDERGSDAFEPLKLLGEGRTGEVLLVRDARPEVERWPLQLRLASAWKKAIPDTYALKIARKGPGESLAARNGRICKELGALERLMHPNIVRSLTAGWHDDRAFFTMELLEGPLLSRILRGERLSYRKSMTLLAELCDAVARCHAQGLLHRDLRPSNLSMSPDRGLVLCGFEWCASSFSEERSTLGVGAAEYASPEYLAYVLDPSVSYVNHPRGDVYSLGVIFFSLLTGQLPVCRTWEDVAEYLRRLRDVKHVSPLRVNPEAPPACAALALRLLSKDRPPDAGELPALVRDAMAQDDAGLDRLVPPYKAGTETLLSSIHVPARRPVSARWRQRWDQGRRLLRTHASRLAVAALVAAITWVNLTLMFEFRARLIRDARLAASSRVVAVQHAELSRVVAQFKAQLAAAAAQRPPAALQKVVTTGLKMPQKPEPQWLKPSADGECRDPASGERLQGGVAVRGACWEIGGRIRPTNPCPKGWYDAPPEVASEPQLRHLRNDCFKPILNVQEPQAANSDAH